MQYNLSDDAPVRSNRPDGQVRMAGRGLRVPGPGTCSLTGLTGCESTVEASTGGRVSRRSSRVAWKVETGHGLFWEEGSNRR